MTCNACTIAAQRRSWQFIGGCDGCKARSIGRSPQFHAVRKAGVQDRAYRNLLQQFSLTHDEVRAAVAADRVHQGDA